MLFETLPKDVVLSILQFSDLQDIFAFSLTCKSCYLISEERSLWIGALTKTRALTPLFCQAYEDFTAHDLISLKNIALRTLRRDHNWSLPILEASGAVQPIYLGEHRLDVVFQIPGTGLFLFHSQSEGQLICWDVGVKKAVSVPLDIGHVVIVDISPGQGDPECYCMALLLGSLDGPISNQFVSLLVVNVYYDRGLDGVRLEATFKHAFEPDFFRRWAVFMNEHMVGLLQANSSNDTPQLEIIAFNRSSHRMAHVTTDISLSRILLMGHSGTSIFNDDLFILIEGGDMSYRYRCPWFYFPYNRNPDCRVESTLVLGSVTPINWVPEFGLEEGSVELLQVAALSAGPSYGVPTASLHQIGITHHEGPPHTDRAVLHLKLHAIFWTRSDNDLANPTLIPKGQINIPGFLQQPHASSWQLMHLAQSGMHILLVMATPEGIPKLQLVRYDAKRGASSIHWLKLPFVVDLARMRGLLVDDHVGSVSLIDHKNFLHVIPYA